MMEAKVPVIDMRRLDQAATISHLSEACRHWGFFQVVGHGVSDGLVAATHEQMRALFALSMEQKRELERTADDPWGFYERELTKNRRDWKQIFDVGPRAAVADREGSHPRWPAAMPEFRRVMEAFYAACETVSFRVLAAIAKSLGLPPTRLHGAFKPRHTSFLRLNYYPACPLPAPPDAPLGAGGHFGVHHHTDAGALTVLLQDGQPGLQVLHEGKWALVEPRADALVINVGDVVQVWSNDRYPAALHRVLANSFADRYSAPFFFNPAREATYAPLPELCSRGERPRYRAIGWEEFRSRRAAGDYADLGEEVQIAHYRIAP
jgi:isopenicillin N synthase-like dioxygenase